MKRRPSNPHRRLYPNAQSVHTARPEAICILDGSASAAGQDRPARSFSSTHYPVINSSSSLIRAEISAVSAGASASAHCAENLR